MKTVFEWLLIHLLCVETRRVYRAAADYEYLRATRGPAVADTWAAHQDRRLERRKRLLDRLIVRYYATPA